MVIEKTTNGDILFGEVIKWKPGSVDKEDLTILTLSDIRTRRNVKVLCWNQKHGAKLSDKARKYQMGDRISVKADFDVGNPNKCTATDIKKSGFYRAITQKGKAVEIIHGKIKTVKKYDTGFSVVLSVFRFSDSKVHPYWCCIDFPDNTKNEKYVKGNVRRGAQVFIHFHDSKESNLNGVKVMTALGEQLTVVA